MWNRLGKWLQEAEWYTEHAARARQAGDLGQALQFIDRAIKLSRRIYRRDGGAGLWTRQFAERLRTRAELRQATRDNRGAVADAEEAIRVFEISQNSQFPLFVPDLRLLLAELHQTLGDREAALRHSTAIEEYRRQAGASGDDHDQLLAARALARYAAVMTALGEAGRAETAAREHVAILRPRIAGIHSVTDLVTFGRIVQQLAAAAEPPNPEAAVELLPLLQDGIEQLARAISDSPLAYHDWAARDRVLALLHLLERQGRWLTALDARQLAALVDHQSRHLVDLPVRQWPAVLSQLRVQLEQAIRRHSDPPHLADPSG